MTKIVATKRLLVLISVTLVCLLVATCGVLGVLDSQRQGSLRATAEAEAFLADAYGTQVSSLIEHFELQWYSLEANWDIGIPSEVAAEPYVNCDNHVGMRPPWSYATSVSVRKVRVLEYGAERFKAVADVTREMAEATARGESVVGSEESIRTCGIYVFIREDDTWKLAGFFNLSPPPKDVARAWDAQPDWLKETIGELPNHDPCGWIGENR